MNATYICKRNHSKPMNQKQQSTEKYFVSMTDKFLSCWGFAEGRISKLVIECNTFEEAEIVEQNAKHRSDMKNVNICSKKPRYAFTTHQVDYRTKSECSNWFVPNYFKRSD